MMRKQMKKTSLFLFACCLAWSTGFGQAPVKIDSSYANWYYQSRQELYDQLTDKVDIVFLGNSITERGEWSELIQKKKIANRGIGGDNSFGVKARLQCIMAQKPSKLFIMIGINDLGRGLSVEVIVNNYRQIVAQLQSGLPKTKLYVQSVLPLNEELLKYDYLKGKNPKVKALNGELQKLAKQYGLTYVNLHEVMAGADGELKKEFTKDGIHLTTDAYLAWAAYLKKKKLL